MEQSKKFLRFVLGCAVVAPWLAACSASVDEDREEAIAQAEGAVCEAPLPSPVVCPAPLWPNGIIPYAYDSSTLSWGTESTPGTTKFAIREAMNQWQDSTRGRIRFVLNAADSERMVIRNVNNCSSGMPGKSNAGLHFVDWAPGCPFAHELGHVIGLFHEHQRSDRDKYVSVKTTAPNCSSFDMFIKCINTNGGGSDFGPYDLFSTEQYNSAGSPPDLVRRSDGAVITTGMGNPTSHDSSAVLELYSGAYGWGKFWTLERNLGSRVPWDPTIAPGVTIVGAPANARRQVAKSLDVFARGSDGAIWGREMQSSNWGEWYTLGLPGGLAAQGDPAAVVANGTTALYVAVETSTGISMKAWHGTWSSWFSIGSPSSGFCSSKNDVALSSWGSNRVDVFATACNGSVWQKSWTGSSWIDWRVVDGSFSSAKPAATSWGSGRIDLFMIAADATLWHRACGTVANCDNGVWGPWLGLGGAAELGSSPSAASRAANRIDVFFVGGDGRLYTRTYAGGGWSPTFDALGGNISGGSVAATSTLTGRIDINAVLRPGSGLWHRWTL